LSVNLSQSQPQFQREFCTFARFNGGKVAKKPDADTKTNLLKQNAVRVKCFADKSAPDAPTGVAGVSSLY
jgi:hypothetical protein